MIKRVVLLSVLCTGSAWAQQNLDISEKDVASGAAQARLSAVARQAASSGKRVVVTAPQHLHAQIAAGLAAGGKADVVLRDGFYENVLVRVEDKVEEPPKVEPKPAPKPVAPPPPPRPSPAPAPATPSRPAAVVERPNPPSPPPVQSRPVAPAPAPVAAPPPPSEPVDLALPPPAAPTRTPAPVKAQAEAKDESEPVSAASAPATIPGLFVASEPGDLSPARTSLEKLYNDGKRIKEVVTPDRLVTGDVIYLGNGAAVVVRRDRPTLLRFWLEGSLDLGQSALEAEGRNKVRVIGARVR